MFGGKIHGPVSIDPTGAGRSAALRLIGWEFLPTAGNLIQAAGPVDVYGIDKNVGLKLFIGKFSLDF